MILLVLLSLIALGWLGDRLFGKQQTPEDHTVQAAREIVSLLSLELEDRHSTLLARLQKQSFTTATGYSLSWMQRIELSLPTSLSEQLESQGSLTLQTEDLITVYQMVHAKDALVAMSFPRMPASLMSVKLGLTLLFYTALAGLLMLWVYPLMARINRLTQVAHAVGKGDFSQSLETSPASRLHTIESEFNRMTQRIQALLEDNRLLSGAVSHDLRTPLARLRFGVDALQEQKHNSTSRNYLERISHDLDLMEQLVCVMLEFVKLDKQLDDLPLGNMSLETVTRECVDAARHNDAISLSLNVDQIHHHIIGEHRFTRMIINNLLGNALKHAQSRVDVSLRKKGDLLWLIVEDDGPGFGNSDKNRILKPFERGDTTHSMSGKSFGLGLAIVKRIVDWYDAEIRLQDSDTLGGARICVGFRLVDN